MQRQIKNVCIQNKPHKFSMGSLDFETGDLRIEKDRPMNSVTTFKIGGPARYYIEIETIPELEEALHFAENLRLPILIMGGGSNMLVSDLGFAGVVIHVNPVFIDFWTEDETTFFIRPKAGELWDDVVRFAVREHLWGIENLSRIPGETGAFVVQNVGAYGVEAKDVVERVHAYDRVEKRMKTLTNAECRFGYRSSIFNTTEKGRYVVFSIVLKLSTIPKPRLNYPDLQRRFSDNAYPKLEEVRQAIIEIRDAKFPYPPESIEGNAGSFFKNIVLTELEYETLDGMFATHLPEHLGKLRQIRHKFPLASGIKIPGAFILEACGLKGFRMGDAMLNPAQPVVVLNASGNAKASEILELVQETRRVVQEKTGLHLLTEPELIGFSSEELRLYGFNAEEIGRYTRL